MRTTIAKQLRDKAVDVAQMFSRQDRGGNTMNEIFDIASYHVLSEVTAAVVFKKSPTNKRAVAFFYYVNSRRQPRWEYFFVSYSHLAGLEEVKRLLHDVEQHNFKVIEDE